MVNESEVIRANKRDRELANLVWIMNQIYAPFRVGFGTRLMVDKFDPEYHIVVSRINELLDQWRDDVDRIRDQQGLARPVEREVR